MTTRTTSRTVTFVRPFLLQDFPALMPAGDYVVVTEEERVDSLLSPAWRRISTVMRVHVLGATEYRPVEPEALHEALMRDGAQDDPAHPPSPASAKGRYDRGRKNSQYLVQGKKH